MIISQVAENLALTPEQKQMLKAAVFVDPPKFTHDIFVNHAVDCFIEDKMFEMNVELYKAELEAHNRLIDDHSECLGS